MGIYHFLILGSEGRQNYLREFLEMSGQEVVQAENYQPGYYDAVLLPVPQTAKYLEENLDSFQRGQIVYGCNFPRELKIQGEKRGVHFVDYMKVDGVAEKNAVATAEGAIAEALKAGCRCIEKSRIFVVGYGRCGRVLTEKLLALGAYVTVIDRKEEKRKEAEKRGVSSMDFSQMTENAGEVDFVVNTVPAPVIRESFLGLVKMDVVIIDIASKPGGVDFDFCRKKGLNANLCLGLPGKYAPKSAAEILCKVIEVDFPFTLR